jgi:hypothetical protein
MAVLSMHVQHDGWPESVARLGRDASLSDLGKLLASCLRRDPRNRPQVSHLRPALAKLSHKYRNVAWPLPLPAAAAATG